MGDMVAVEGYLVRYWFTIASLITGSILSMICLVAAVVVDAFHAYSKTWAWFLLSTTVLGLLLIVVFWISSTRYIFTSGVGHVAGLREESESGSEADFTFSSTRDIELSETSTAEDSSIVENGVFRLRCH